MAFGQIPSDEVVLAHGFAFEPQYWRELIAAPWWPELFDRLPEAAERAGYRNVTRGDVLTLAHPDTEVASVQLLLTACIWGAGDNKLSVQRVARVFTSTPLHVIGERLLSATRLLDTEGPVAAYDSLSTGANRIANLGPAFFTKYLYFAAGHPAAVKPQPLILDRKVAQTLNTHFDGWHLPETGWYPRTYGEYLAFAAQQAAAIPGASPHGIEMALYLMRE